MKITLAGYVLADSAAGIYAQSKSLNGQVIAQGEDLVRASQRRFFARGNASTTYGFTTWQTFPTLADAQDYYYGVRALVPSSGPLLVYQVGALAGRPPATLARAVLTSVVPTLLGLTVQVDWTVQGGLFVTAATIAAGGDGGGAPVETEVNVMRGTTPITDGLPERRRRFPDAFRGPAGGASQPGLQRPSRRGGRARHQPPQRHGRRGSQPS